MKKNQYGFSVVEVVIVLVVLSLLGLGALYVWNSNKSKTGTQPVDTTSVPKQETSTIVDKKTYDSAKTTKIKNFDTASDSLKEVLISTYYADAKKNCDIENASVSAEARLDWVMAVQKMVRDDFAGVQFCGSGGTSMMARVEGEWKKVGSLAMAPGCSIVDQYKISKEITPTCYIDGTSNTREVTYP